MVINIPLVLIIIILFWRINMATIKKCDLCGNYDIQEPILEYNLPKYTERNWNNITVYELQDKRVRYIPKKFDICQLCAKRISDLMDSIKEKGNFYP